MGLGRIVVVGCGSIGSRHAINLSRRNDVALELCDPYEHNLAKTIEAVGKVPTHHSFDDMVLSSPPMVIIATPPSLHAQQVISALHAGSHVLCEKPMSDSLEDARRMVRVAKETKRVLDIGFTMHFHPGVRRVKEMIDSGQLGRILHVHWHIGTYDTLANSTSRHQAGVYGALIMDYAHQPDLLYYWLRKIPISVWAYGAQGARLPLYSNPNVISITLKYDGPLIATINLNYVQCPQRAYCEIVGDRAWVCLDLQCSLLTVGLRHEPTPMAIPMPVDRDSLFQAEHQAFLDATQGLRLPESPPQQALHSMRIVEAAIRSLRSQELEVVDTCDALQGDAPAKS